MRFVRHFALATLFCATAMASSAPIRFVVAGGDMKARQMLVVESEAEFEDFTGRSHDVTGTIVFDPVKKTGGGTLVLDLSTLDTGIPMRNEHMLGEMWLDTAKYPKATFRTTSVKRTSGDNYAVRGHLTLRGVTRTVKTNVFARYTKANAATKTARFEGDVLHVKTSFKLRLADYGIKVPANLGGKVAGTVTIRVTTFAQSG